MDWTTTDENRKLAERTLLLNGYGAYAGVWQPDWRASLPLAALLMLLLVAGLASLPYQWWVPAPKPQTISITLDQTLPEKPKALRKPVHQTKSAKPVPHKQIVTKPPVSRPPPINWQQQIDEAAQAQAKSETQITAPQAKPLDRHLERLLNAPRHTPDMQNGQAYRSSSGQTIIKSGDQCGSVQTVQIGPSPTNRATIGTLVPCPGEYKPTMGDQLKAWAEKRARKHPPP